MKSKKILLMTIIFMITMLTCTAVYAQNSENENVYTFADIVYESSSPIVSETSSARAIWMTYEKTIIYEYTSKVIDPGYGDFPQSIYYSEQNPSGYGDFATGTLYLQAVFPGEEEYQWFLSYTGTLGYYLL